MTLASRATFTDSFIGTMPVSCTIFRAASMAARLGPQVDLIELAVEPPDVGLPQAGDVELLEAVRECGASVASKRDGERPPSRGPASSCVMSILTARSPFSSGKDGMRASQGVPS